MGRSSGAGSTCSCAVTEEGQRKCAFDPAAVAKCLPAFCNIDSLELYQAGLGRKDMKHAQVEYFILILSLESLQPMFKSVAFSE